MALNIVVSISMPFDGIFFSRIQRAPEHCDASDALTIKLQYKQCDIALPHGTYFFKILKRFNF